jgi:coenzyme F420-reducing hydrogenase alpha subunit
MSDRPRTRTIRVDQLARVEGEGALYLKLRGDRVVDAELRIFEPPRFFEALLRGRRLTEAPDITARICGICPVAYQMSAVHAMEAACGVHVDGPLRALRRLLYCGEWIQSHALHVYLLHAPDFLGYESALALAQDHRAAVERGLQLKKVGNAIMALVGGREVHPINVRVGGFYRAPTRAELGTLIGPLEEAREAAVATVRWAATFPFPDFDLDYELVSLRHPDEYPFNEGRLVSTAGLDIAVDEFDDHVVEEHVARSHALHARLRERGTFLVGPLARYSLNFDRLSPLAQEAAREAGLGPVCRNPFRSILVRAVEIVYACDEALRLIAAYEEPDQPALAVEPRAGTGRACTEAPRGTLYHRFTIDEQGIIEDAKIVPPTSQNQKAIEGDLAHFAQRHLVLPKDELTLRCEQVIRNYDPCISCATHFLELHVEDA